jgi:hypothetical protein
MIIGIKQNFTKREKAREKWGEEEEKPAEF